MVTDVYSHIIDKDRCKNAQNLQNAFYNKNDVIKKSSIEEKSKQLLELINQSPELADLLLKTLNAK